MKKIRLFRKAISLALILLLTVNLTGMSLTVYAEYTIYESGRYVYVGDLKMGDLLDEGVILYPSKEDRVGVTYAPIIIDNVEQCALHKSNPEYTTDRKYKVRSVTVSPYT